MADPEEVVTAGIAANAFIVAEATADEFERSFVRAIEFAHS
jgi:adenine/guanine phosphoribosyltransferase-like PRPP-binding protein